MERLALWMKVIVVLVLGSAVVQVMETPVLSGDSNPVLARVGPITVTAEQLREYAVHRPDLVAFVGSEAGTRKILEAWLEEQLLSLYVLKLEGQDPFKALPNANPSDLAAKIQKFMKQEFPPLPAATDEEALAYYGKNSHLYTIPARLHVKKMWFVLEGAAPETKEKAWAVLEEAKKALDSGAPFEAAYEAAHNKIPELKSWDVGFVPMDGSFEGQDLVEGLSSGQSVTWRNQEGLFLFQVVQRKPERTESFENVKELVKKDLEKDRAAKRRAAFFERLKKEFDAHVML
jgi:hypothetical protein